MIIMHAYTYRTYDFERCCKKAREHGWDGLELHPCHFKGQSLAEAQGWLGETMARHGVLCPTASWGGNVIQDDAEAAKQALEESIAGLPLLKELGVSLVNTSVGALMATSEGGPSGSAIATEVHYERAAAMMQVFARELDSLGLLGTFEIHMHCLHDTASSTLKMLEMIGSPLLTANLDAGNMYGTPHAEEACEAVRILGSHLGYVHAKNCRRLPGGGTDYSYRLEEGHLDYFRILQALRDTGYAGHVCCEYCGLGDPSVAAQADLNYLQRTLRELGMW